MNCLIQIQKIWEDTPGACPTFNMTIRKTRAANTWAWELSPQKRAQNQLFTDKTCYKWKNHVRTNSKRSDVWEAIAFPLIIIWLDGSAFPLTDDVEGYTEIPPVLRPISWLSWTKSRSPVPISSNDWLQPRKKALETGHSGKNWKWIDR